MPQRRRRDCGSRPCPSPPRRSRSASRTLAALRAVSPHAVRSSHQATPPDQLQPPS